MNRMIFGALVALTAGGMSTGAFADAEHRHGGRHGQGATTPQAGQAHQHGSQRMAEMHARMSAHHGTPQAGSSTTPRGPSGQQHEHRHGEQQHRGH